jgi:type IV pilus assembly protein PilV
VRGRAAGFTLIEVLVSILVFSVGVLGLVGLQAQVTRNSVEASERGRAAMMANELIAEMWKAGSTTVPDAAYTAWEARVKDPKVLGLNEGEGKLDYLKDEVGTVVVTITWTSVVRDGETSRYFTEFAFPPKTED